MKVIQLDIETNEPRELVLSLEWSEGTLRRRHVDHTLEGTVQRWESRGLNEWIGEGVDVMPRETPPTDAAFLPRLESYLKRQSGLSIHLRETEAADLDVFATIETTGDTTNAANQ